MTEAVSDTCALKLDPLHVPQGSGVDSSTICNPDFLTFDRSNRNSGLIISMASDKRVLKWNNEKFYDRDISSLN